jgi:predicted nucleic acid-binding protein
MIVYLDASVVLRLVLGEAGALADREQYAGAVASALTEVECLRTLDRLATQGTLTSEEVADGRMAVYQLLEEVDLLDISPVVLRRAGEPFSTPLGTLDAIHLASALHWRDVTQSELTIATHDKALATAARASGITVVGS